MGVSCSCPLAAYCDLQNGIIESFFGKSNDNGSITFQGKDLQPEFLPPCTQPVKHSKGELGENEFMFREVVGRLLESGSSMDSPVLGGSSPKDKAALRLQKVYKSFRTRRKLADCAVLIEQTWWKLLDFAELKHSSISFFDLDKHESAVSRWSRARTKAAKVGKGLSENSKAQKLALQHWLEAIDPRHRYGHNLHFYYIKWMNSQSKEPFFYWLDIGEGKEVNLNEKCPRSKLQLQCIKYLGPMERMEYEVAMKDGILHYKATGELLDTTGDAMDTKWIFVLSTSRTLYTGKKKKGSFQHSSFLAGGATLAAGRIIAEKGTLKAVWPHSGHYRPTPENFLDFISFLRENKVDLTDVKLDPMDDEAEYSARNSESHLKSNSSEDDSDEKANLETEQDDAEASSSSSEDESSKSTVPSKKPTTLLIPSKQDVIEAFLSKTRSFHLDSPMEYGHEAEPPEGNLDSGGVEEEIIPGESILQRINSHKETKSYQLGKQLSSPWSTGAGPRIGCLRDYPSELQNHTLERVKLSPGSERRLRIEFGSRASTPGSSTLWRNGSRQSCSITNSSPGIGSSGFSR